jgi:hypothetical protein
MNMTNEELKELVASLAISQRETDRQIQETERLLRESKLEAERQFEETKRILRESKLEVDRQFRETDRQIQETEQLFRESKLETDRQLRESKLEADRQFQELRESKLEIDRQLCESKLETDRQLRESKLDVDRQLKTLRTEIGGIGNKFGSFTEGMALPAIEKILHDEFGLDRFYPNAKSLKGDRTLEIDVLGYSNGTMNKVVIVEVKSHLRLRDIEQVLQILQAFPEFFPEHADKKLYGMIAAVAMNKEARQQVLEAGLYLGRIHDEQFKLTIPHHFEPRCFSQTGS